MANSVTNATSPGTSHVAMARQGRRQDWITVRLGPSWLAAYRVVFEDLDKRRRARIVELRIVPSNSPARFEPAAGYEYYVRRARQEKRKVEPFSFESVHRLVTLRHFADALAAVDAMGVGEHLRSRLETPPRRRGAGRPASRPKRFYAEFAIRYDALENDTRRERGSSTRALLADEYHVLDSTVGKWIHKARVLGFLTQVVQGRRGGRATQAARDCKRDMK